MAVIVTLTLWLIGMYFAFKYLERREVNLEEREYLSEVQIKYAELALRISFSTLSWMIFVFFIWNEGIKFYKNDK